MSGSLASAVRLAVRASALSAALLVAASAAAQVDPHKLYELRCKSCHNEHAADLARQRMTLDGSVLNVASSGKPVAELLKKHHGVKLPDVEAQPLLVLFANGIRWKGVFQAKCARCHGEARTFARDTLALRDAVVVVKKTGAEVRPLLATHGEATGEEAAILAEMLRYQLETAPK